MSGCHHVLPTDTSFTNADFLTLLIALAKDVFICTTGIGHEGPAFGLAQHLIVGLRSLAKYNALVLADPNSLRDATVIRDENSILTRKTVAVIL